MRGGHGYLIIGGPALGFLWLYLGHTSVPKPIPPVAREETPNVGVPAYLKIEQKRIADQFERLKQYDLIPISEVWDIARNRGWAQNWWEFNNALLHARRAGSLKVWARPATNPQGAPSPKGDLEIIPTHLFEDAKISAPMMAAGGGNFGPGTAIVTPKDPRKANANPMQHWGYVDIHLSRAPALKWLEEDAD